MHVNAAAALAVLECTCARTRAATPRPRGIAPAILRRQHRKRSDAGTRRCVADVRRPCAAGGRRRGSSRRRPPADCRAANLRTSPSIPTAATTSCGPDCCQPCRRRSCARDQSDLANSTPAAARSGWPTCSSRSRTTSGSASTSIGPPTRDQLLDEQAGYSAVTASRATRT